MKYAICNELFGHQPFDKAWRSARELAYTGIEITPLTLLPEVSIVDVRDVSAAWRAEVKSQAADTGLDVVGLHWLLAKTDFI